jgi:GDP-4-dehydro-6-deoxy-D-mannose reductase
MPGPVLVTGAAGFVGSHLIDLLLARGHAVAGWFRPGTAPGGAPISWTAVELLDRAAVRAALSALEPAAIYHLAGAAHAGDSANHPRETFEGNALATHRLIEALRAAGRAPRILISGSATVYKPVPRPLTESNAVGASSPYATSKLAQEMIARHAHEEWGVPVLLARAFNHVGPRQTPAYVAPSIARQVAMIERGLLAPELKMGNLDPKRDVMDVRDTVRAYLAMMERATPATVYNICSGRAMAIGALVDLFLARARVPIRVVRDPSRMRANDVPVLYGSHERLTADTGWRPEIPLERTVDDLLAYWRAQPLT